MMAVPTDFPVTAQVPVASPAEATVATDSSLLDHTRRVSVALLGQKSTLNVALSPTRNSISDLSNEMLSM